MKEMDYNKIAENLIMILPNDWEKVVLYTQINNDAYELFFHVKVDGNFYQCYNLDKVFGITSDQINATFDELYKLILPDWKDKYWFVCTFILDKNGEFKVDYEYTNYSESTLKYKKDWKNKYLLTVQS